jgi:pyranose oxidase
MSTNVGGMGAHWTCACPHPYGRERIPFIADREWDGLVEEGRRVLGVRTDAFPRTRQGEAILRTLSRELDPELPPGRTVQRMPLACRSDARGAVYWSGTDVVLGPLAVEPQATFELRPDTLCTRVIIEDDRATGVVLVARRTGASYAVAANAVVLACDSFRTPQLLWASGIRPRALGHFLNDHVQILAAVRLDDELVAEATADLSSDDLVDTGAGPDPMVGVFWVPYADDAHPFHSQVMHWDMSPLALRGEGDGGHVVGIGALIGKAELRYDDCVTFSETEVDPYGLPRPTIAYELTERDHEHVARVRAQQDRAAAAFGSYAPGREPRVLPPGSSLHYQGTVRMGEHDDGESVCDPYARVWGVRSLFVGGNGVIPTITAGNPTLTSVAVAVRSARMLASEL